MRPKRTCRCWERRHTGRENAAAESSPVLAEERLRPFCPGRRMNSAGSFHGKRRFGLFLRPPRLGGARTYCFLKVKSQLEEKEGKTFDVFTAVEFKTQLVAGTNYFIKVHVGNEEFMHLRVFKSLPHENEQLSLHSYQGSKTKHDELAYF
ncbi:PREDICTED: cystatin-B-like [Ficedula albicollis]|uniref:cystatin-B-like n=1 Tax=Ficedula albicollis TaxID=59894 RepID=UPI000359A263|nr:PREDICTED: cystatin-B-like [Ficedula albicollis]